MITRRRVSDPVTPGLVASLAHPGGSITGVTFGVGGEGFGGKWVELLKEAAPLPRSRGVGRRESS